MTKKYANHENLHQKILRGVNILADNVASTLGPSGRNVLLYNKSGSPVITKDGVTVARFIELEDEFENVAAQVIKQAAAETNSIAGYGTTTATVLARAIFRDAQKYLVAGANPTEMKRGMDAAASMLVDELRDISRPVASEEDIRNIATISANGDEVIGELIATAVDKIGKDGAISIEEAKSMDTSLEIIEGFRFQSGYFSKSFVTDERRGAVVYDSPLVLVTDHKINLVEDIYPVLEIVARDNRPLIVVAEEVEGQALAALIMNTTRGTLKVAAVKAPSYGEDRRNILKDLCIATGATFISRESNMSLGETKLNHLGSCRKIEIMKYLTTIVGGKGDYTKIDARIESLKEEIAQTEDLRECTNIQDRITRLASGIALIKVGAPTEVEMIEKKHRIEDALEAVKSAQAEGLLPGGGVALYRASEGLRCDDMSADAVLGFNIVKDVASEPIRQLSKNANVSADIILEKVKNSSDNQGYDFANHIITDMYDNGIIDPLRVTKTALLNAVSVASTLLTTNYAIIEE